MTEKVQSYYPGQAVSVPLQLHGVIRLAIGTFIRLVSTSSATEAEIQVHSFQDAYGVVQTMDPVIVRVPLSKIKRAN